MSDELRELLEDLTREQLLDLLDTHYRLRLPLSRAGIKSWRRGKGLDGAQRPTGTAREALQFVSDALVRLNDAGSLERARAGSSEAAEEIAEELTDIGNVIAEVLR